MYKLLALSYVTFWQCLNYGTIRDFSSLVPVTGPFGIKSQVAHTNLTGHVFRRNCQEGETHQLPKLTIKDYTQ